MKKFWVISLILFLILFTAFIKNSTKKIEDELFTIKESLQILNKDHENIKLEFDYLSSAEKLLEYQNLYFEEELIQKGIQEIRIIKKNDKKLLLENLKITVK
jgi:hypothetical protein